MGPRAFSQVFSKFSQNLENFENVRNLSIIAREHLRLLAYHIKRKILYKAAKNKVLPSRKQVCQLSLKNRPAVARQRLAKIANKTQQVQFTQSISLQTKLEQSNFLHLFCEVCNDVKLLQVID